MYFILTFILDNHQHKVRKRDKVNYVIDSIKHLYDEEIKYGGSVRYFVKKNGHYKIRGYITTAKEFGFIFVDEFWIRNLTDLGVKVLNEYARRSNKRLIHGKRH